MIEDVYLSWVSYGLTCVTSSIAGWSIASWHDRRSKRKAAELSRPPVTSLLGAESGDTAPPLRDFPWQVTLAGHLEWNGEPWCTLHYLPSGMVELRNMPGENELHPMHEFRRFGTVAVAPSTVRRIMKNRADFGLGKKP